MEKKKPQPNPFEWLVKVSSPSGDIPTLTLAKMEKLYQHVYDQMPKLVIARIVHNGCEDWFAQFFDRSMNPNHRGQFTISGIPLYEDTNLPFGEIRLLDKDNNTLRTIVYVGAGHKH